jgi:hypothetical protein
VTAPARSLAWSVSTAVFKGLLLSRSILVRNSRCVVSVKEARKEWHSPKEVLNSANIEGRDRRGLVQLPNSIGLHGARGLKVQILKGTKEHQVQSSFVRITVIAPLDSVQGTHSTNGRRAEDGFDQDLCYVVAGIFKQRQFVQGWTWIPGSCPDPGVDVSNLKKYVKLGINLVISKNVTFPS